MQRWTAIRERYDPERGDEYVFCELDESDDGDYVRFDDASDRIAALESQLAEAERTIVELRGAAEADEQRLRDAAACAGVGWFGCDTPEVLADTIAELRAALRTKGESLGDGVVGRRGGEAGEGGVMATESQSTAEWDYYCIRCREAIPEWEIMHRGYYGPLCELCFDAQEYENDEDC